MFFSCFFHVFSMNFHVFVVVVVFFYVFFNVVLWFSLIFYKKFMFFLCFFFMFFSWIYMFFLLYFYWFSVEPVAWLAESIKHWMHGLRHGCSTIWGPSLFFSLAHSLFLSLSLSLSFSLSPARSIVATPCFALQCFSLCWISLRACHVIGLLLGQQRLLVWLHARNAGQQRLPVPHSMCMVGWIH